MTIETLEKTTVSTLEIVDSKKNEGSILITAVDSQSSTESDQLKKNPFLDPKVEAYYRQVYSECNYESYSAFDPQFEWTDTEEKKVIKKLNYRVALAACLMFVSLQIDRGNLQQAVTDNLLDDLGMDTNDYNFGNTIFKIAFLLAEIPSQLISKSLGPDIFIPIQICSWSIVAMAQAALSGKTSFLITRALIGALEGGFIADLVLWLSYFFTSKELPVRLSWFWTTLAVVGILTSILAFGLLRMRGILGWAGWRWLFLIEGFVTLLIGISSFYMMVPSAVETKNWMHPKGWFTDREVKIVVNRILRDDPSKGSMHNRQGLTIKMLVKSLWDFDLWPIFTIGLFVFIGYFTLGNYFGLINRQLGFNVFDTNLLAIPHQVLHIILLLSITWFSERVNERSLVCMIVPLYATPIIAAIRFWPQAGKDVWATWALNTLYMGQPFVHAICVAWVSRNSNSVRTRSISSALYNMFVQLGTIIGSNVYRQDDLPLYYRGNMQLFCIGLASFPLLALIKYYYVWRNKTKSSKWNAMSEDEKEYYRNNTKDEGARRLDFQFAH
ncbi:putative transporter [Spathaspora sp. JA1]|nr:putative transporter [Spathaspora sp. JA1]